MKSTARIMSESCTQFLKSTAHRLGFTLTGVCPAVAPTGVSRLAEWLDRGYSGEMHYIAARQDAYSHPRHVLGGVRSILMLGLPYASKIPLPSGEGGDRRSPGEGVISGPSADAEAYPKSKIQNLKSPTGRISRYALGPDYHDVIHDKLKQLIATLQEIAPNATARGIVDTAPLLEREFAQLAGLGWIGKHTLLIHRQRPYSVPGSSLGPHYPEAPASSAPSSSGSYFFLAALLTDQELQPDDPFTADHCGTCRACLDACPTQAFPQPYVLDATRCISYLTIELKSPIPRDLRPGMGDWLFGCDVCQDVCPWNRDSNRIPQIPIRFSVPGSPLGPHNPQAPASSDPYIDLLSLFSLDDAAFRLRFRDTPLWRPRRRGILRNAAIVLGNTLARSAGDENTLARSASEGNAVSTAAIAALSRGLNDVEPLIRGACAWALGQIGGEEARQALAKRQSIESDATVREEIDAAL
jgi:epoxyqueuosine reductase